MNKKFLTTLAVLSSILLMQNAFAYEDLNDIPKPTRKDMHYYYANRGKVPTPRIQVRGHWIILENRNTYAPSVSKLKNKRHYHRVMANNYGY